MKTDGFRILIILIAISLIPAYSNALVEEKSSIMGSVIGAADKPLSGITIRLLDSYFLVEVTKTVTDQEGKFTLSNLLPGLYLISVEIPLLSGIVKRVEVVSGTPTFVDLRSVLSDEELQKHNAWDQFKWTIRVAERNPLREEQGPANPTYASHYTSDSFLAFLRNLKESNNIKGEFSYVSVGAGPSSTSWSHQMAQFAVEGQLEGEGTWSINGNFLEGPRLNYIASGQVQHPFYGHLIGAEFAANDLLFAKYPGIERDLIRNFVAAPDPGGSEESKLWITSVDLKDQWQFFPWLGLQYGTRIDYYGYMHEPVSYSPRLALIYQFTPSFTLSSRYYQNHSAPGNYYLQPDEVHPYVHDLAFVPFEEEERLSPETTVGYEASVRLGDSDSHFSAYYRVERISNKIATIDLADSPINEKLQSFHPFVIFNAGNLRSRTTGFQISKRISPMITAVASYNLTHSDSIYIIEKQTLGDRHLFFKNGDEMVDFHDVQAGIEANIQQTQTEVRADWKWSSGSPLVYGREEDNVPLAALDLEVHQGIPVQVFSETQLELLLAIKNLLDQNPDTSNNADFQRALLYSMPRVIAGGLLLKF